MLRIEPLFFEEPPVELEGPWQELAEQAFAPSFQLEFPVVSSWCRNLRAGWQPFVLLAREGDAVRGILPLMYLDERRRGFLPYRRIRQQYPKAPSPHRLTSYRSQCRIAAL